MKKIFDFVFSMYMDFFIMLSPIIIPVFICIIPILLYGFFYNLSLLWLFVVTIPAGLKCSDYFS